uniref:Tetraspanin-33 n=1 Tax=Amazona collaria TaxID=241587 RepID=A0A8B9F5Q7_9PSIT
MSLGHLWAPMSSLQCLGGIFYTFGGGNIFWVFFNVLMVIFIVLGVFWRWGLFGGIHPTGLWPLCCGRAWPSRSSHPQFSICLAIVFLLQLVAGVLGFVFSDKARGKVSEIINGAIMHYRDDLDLQNLIDFGQKEFSCCGGVSYKDWSQNMYFNCTMDNPSQERCSVPFSCCLPDDDEVVINTMCGHGIQAMGYVEASAVIYTHGCIDSLVNWINRNLFLLGGIALGLAAPQLVGILLAQILISQIRDQIKLQLYNQQHRADPLY